MRNTFVSLVTVVWLLALPAAAAAQDQIVVDTTLVVADVARKPIGVNVNFLLDDDTNRASARHRLADALRAAGVKYLRYPGGEKSDNYLWSVPPYATSVPTLARWATGEWPVNQEWPSYDRNLVETDGRTFKVSPLDFDEFMEICREIDCIPTVVVCYDSMYKPAQAGGVAPTRAQLLETAREWVRYANLTKGYNVKYWEIGNESWQPHYNGSATAANYARDLIEFSRVMKGVDPTILIGANGESDSWWQTVLPTASSAIDFLAIHNYPSTGWGSYSYYQNNSVNLLAPEQAALKAISTYAPAADRNRLTIATTEMNAADWNGGWPHRNDLGHALVVFDTFGTHLLNPDVEFTQLWNTRWSGNDSAPTPVLWDAVNKDNELQATGLATAVWGQFLKETLVASSSTSKVRSYATRSPGTGKSTVFLINKDTVARAATVAIKSSSAFFSIDRWDLTGTGPDDLYPTWQQRGAALRVGNSFAVTLPPVSITVIDATPAEVVHSVPTTIQAEDFRNGAFWDATAGNSGNAYRSTDVDIESTSDAGGGFNLGWITAGEWLDYTIQVPAAGQYDLSARIASPYSGKSFRLLVNGQDVTGNISVPTTGGWQAWQTVTRANIYLPAGTHRATVVAATDGFNLNWVSIKASAAEPTHPIPGLIEAEQFRDAGYWDSTAGNSGSVYRATDVDIETTRDTNGGFNVGWIAAGEWLEYNISVPTAGYYDFVARVASIYSGKSLRILVDNVDVTGNLAIPNTAGWQNWQTVSRSNIHLTAGIHRLRATAITDGFNVNWFSFNASSGNGRAIPGVLQAEDFDDGAYADSTAGNLGGSYRATDVDIQPTTDAGGGFNIGWMAPGEWQEHTILVSTAGYYDLSVRLASPNTGRSFRVLLNGADVSGSMIVPNTGGYQSWQTVIKPRIYLTAGTHQLRFAPETTGFNLNWLSLTSSQ